MATAPNAYARVSAQSFTAVFEATNIEKIEVRNVRDEMLSENNFLSTFRSSFSGIGVQVLAEQHLGKVRLLS